MKLILIEKKVGGLTYYEPGCENSRLIMWLMGRGRRCFTKSQVKEMQKAGWEIIINTQKGNE